jgi:hypothetical protein
MTWNTPLGSRLLDTTEQAFFLAAFYDMAKKIAERSVSGGITTGVPTFDGLAGCEQTAMLDAVKKCLCEETPESTARLSEFDSVVAAAIAFVHDEIENEIITENGYSNHLGHMPQRKWRMFLGKIFDNYDWKIKSKNQLKEWSQLLASFQDRILKKDEQSALHTSSIDNARLVRGETRSRISSPVLV